MPPILPAPSDLSLRQLQYVVAVADTLGFHKAAHRCHVSQPTLSAQIRKLEDALGVTIFERDRRRVLVTSAGSDLVACARRVLAGVDDLLVAATRVRDPFAATLRIGVLPTIAPYLLPEVMPKVGERHPKLSLVFREEKTAEITHDLTVGSLDAGLLALEADLTGWARAEIMKDPFVVALPKGHRLSRGSRGSPRARPRRLLPSDLEGDDVLLLDEGHCFRDQALALCNQARAVEIPFRATSLATLAQMVSSGAGITLLPSIAVPVENRRGQFDVRPFSAPAPGRTLGLVWRLHSPLEPVFFALAETLRNAAARLVHV